MKKFKNKKLYEQEIGHFTSFVENILETKSEYNSKGRYRNGIVEKEEEETIDFADDAFGSFDFGSDGDEFGDSWGDLMGGFNSGSGDSVKFTNPREYEDTNNRNAINLILQAPPHILAVGQKLIDKQVRENHPKTMVYLFENFKWFGLFIMLGSLLSISKHFVFFIHPVVGVLMGILGVASDLWCWQSPKYDSFVEKILKDDDEEETEENVEEEETDDGGFDFGSLGEDDDSGGFDFSGFGDFDGFDETDTSLADRYIDDDDAEDDDDEDWDDEDAFDIESYFPNSNVDTSGSYEDYRSSLIEVFNDYGRYKGRMPLRRGEIVKQFAKYMPENTKGFSKWTNIKEHSAEYDNIAYTIFKSVSAINTKFNIDNAIKNEDKLTILEMKRTPLLYKMTIKLPSYIKPASITNKGSVFTDYIKARDDDSEVGVLLSTYGGNLVVKYLRLGSSAGGKGGNLTVSIGDLLRYEGENPKEEDPLVVKFSKEKGLPMVAGMMNNEYPYMVDFEGNPAASVVGGSGSGKSWLTFQFMVSMMISNSPEELNFLVMDSKDAAIWKQFALSPHVIGYHSNYLEYLDILYEIRAEHERRMAYLSELGVEDWKSLREMTKKKGNYEELRNIPMLLVIIDEITFTMTALQGHDEKMYKAFKAELGALSAVIRASGIRMMLIGQRAVDTSIPKTYLANSPLKLGMKMNVEGDFKILLGDDVLKRASKIPYGPGEGLMLAEGQPNVEYVKTAVPAGRSTEEILAIVRTMALDWVRRTQGGPYDYTTIYNDMSKTIVKGFNRNEYYNTALLALEERKITSPRGVDNDYRPMDAGVLANYVEPAPVEEVDPPRSRRGRHRDEEDRPPRGRRGRHRDDEDRPPRSRRGRHRHIEEEPELDLVEKPVPVEEDFSLEDTDFNLDDLDSVLGDMDDLDIGDLFGDDEELSDLFGDDEPDEEEDLSSDDLFEDNSPNDLVNTIDNFSSGFEDNFSSGSANDFSSGSVNDFSSGFEDNFISGSDEIEFDTKAVNGGGLDVMSLAAEEVNDVAPASELLAGLDMLKSKAKPDKQEDTTSDLLSGLDMLGDTQEDDPFAEENLLDIEDLFSNVDEELAEMEDVDLEEMEEELLEIDLEDLTEPDEVDDENELEFETLEEIKARVAKEVNMEEIETELREEIEEQIMQEEEAKIRAELQAQIEQETRLKLEQEFAQELKMRQQAEQERLRQAELEERKRAQLEARKAAEAKLRKEVEAKMRAELEAKMRKEMEEKLRAEMLGNVPQAFSNPTAKPVPEQPQPIAEQPQPIAEQPVSPVIEEKPKEEERVVVPIPTVRKARANRTPPANIARATTVTSPSGVNKQPVDQYIMMHGETTLYGKHRMKKEELKAIYTDRKIEVALSTGSIYARDGYYYQT